MSQLLKKPSPEEQIIQDGNDLQGAKLAQTIAHLQESATECSPFLTEIFSQSRTYLEHFFTHLDLASAQKVFEHLLISKGTIFLTGVGKSGIIAEKIAMTLCSSGTKAIYLSPLNALHGDIGMVSKGDTVLFFSNSGETDELIQLCPAIRNKGAHLIAVVSKSESRLVKACNQHVILPVLHELCPFDMVPTTSTLVQLIFGDAIAIALMRAKQFSADDFRQNHPSGRLGKRMFFTVADLMLTGSAIPFVSPQALLVQVLVDFSSKQCGCLIVVNEEQQLLGIFTDGDLRRSLQKHGASVLQKELGEIMTPNPRSIHHQVLAFDAMKFMEADQKRPITVLPVVDHGNKVVGILKMHDIVQSGI